jgi:DNA-binding transcriptional LysR family regulator
MVSPTLRQLRTLLAAVEAGSVSAAARRLGLTQPAASQQLRDLERALGVRLLDRAAGRVIPTAAGAAILDPARRVQAATADVVAAAERHRGGEVGQVRLGTGATACIYLLPPMLAAAKQRMPGLEITVATGNTPDMLRQVESGGLDIAFITMPLSLGRSLSGTRVLSDPLAALLPDTMAPPAATMTPEHIAGLPLILYEAGGNTRGLVDGWFRRAGLSARPIMELGNVEAIKVLVGSGLGASILPELALRAPVPGAVTRRLRPVVARNLGYVLRREKVLNRGLQVLIAELERIAAGSRP